MNTEFYSKGWGYELWITNNDKYCGKKLFFSKGRRCSWHYHAIKDEVFFANSGRLLVFYSQEDCLIENKLHVFEHGYLSWTNSDYVECYKDQERMPFPAANSIILEPGDTFHVPPGLRHQMYGMVDTEMFEFSTTHNEEDSIRLLKGD